LNYIGIDPGKKGGIAVIYEGGEAMAWPLTEEMLLAVCKKQMIFKPRCCLEKVGARPGQGVTSMFHFGEGYGYIRGVLESFGIPYQEIPPQRWKKEFGLTSDKQSSIEVCRRLFPETGLRTSERSKTDSDGMAEALLMAEYARRRL
jgi:crossover junction endodeoxyribonuclease RuvC